MKAILHRLRLNFGSHSFTGSQSIRNCNFPDLWGHIGFSIRHPSRLHLPHLGLHKQNINFPNHKEPTATEYQHMPLRRLPPLGLLHAQTFHNNLETHHFRFEEPTHSNPPGSLLLPHRLPSPSSIPGMHIQTCTEVDRGSCPNKWLWLWLCTYRQCYGGYHSIQMSLYQNKTQSHFQMHIPMMIAGFRLQVCLTKRPTIGRLMFQWEFHPAGHLDFGRLLVPILCD